MIVSFSGSVDHRLAKHIDKVSLINLSIIYQENISKISRKADLVIKSYLNSNNKKVPIHQDHTKSTFSLHKTNLFGLEKYQK